uniref:Uncharacterized protein n=1 Tax=Felis catus TaxID=9685 RepID=A0ABI7XUS4_FELCA
MTEQMTFRGILKGHNGWMTQIATTSQFPDVILSVIVDELKQEVINTSSKTEPSQCTSPAWSVDGQTLFACYMDNLVCMW